MASSKATRRPVSFACWQGLLVATLLSLSAHADDLPKLELPADNPKLDTPEQKAAPTAFAQPEPVPKLNYGVGDGKSFTIPALDIFVFDFSLNQFDRRYATGRSDYDVTLSTIKHNLTHGWTQDDDAFTVNQFGHPYQGSMYHGFARSAGLSYWQASAYTLLGSAGWEIAGEKTKPSLNDEFTTGFAGSFLGEPLFRLSSLLLESSNGRPGFWRELGAAAISPSTGFNRLAFGDRFDGVFDSHDPAVYTRLDLGVNVGSTVSSTVNRATSDTDPPIPQAYKTGEALGDFTVAYGLPGKPGYTYDRPFDYFNLQFTAASSNALENVMVRGLLLGNDFEAGDDARGIWGLYGTYDYIAPQIFRVSTTAASLGTTGQWWLARSVAVQGTALAGAGYGSAGTIHGSGDRDYHNGITPQGLLNLRLIVSDRVSFDVTTRGYYVSSLASQEKGEEKILRTDAALTFRIWNLHGLTIKYVATHRNATYDDMPDTRQRVAAISIGYTYLGQTRSGAVDWRPASEGGP